MTIPRELSLTKTGKNYLLASKPVTEVNKIAEKVYKLNNANAGHLDLTSKAGKLKGPALLKIGSDKIDDFSLTLSNSLGQKLLIGFDKTANQFFIDRRSSGKINFEKSFAAKHTAPRLTSQSKFDLLLLIDDASVELFADNGLTVMTEIFFPDEKFSDIVIESNKEFQIKDLQLTTLRSIYK
jgi:fructan beta-fructosidase